MIRAALLALLLCAASTGCNAGDVVLYAPADAGVDSGGSAGSSGAAGAGTDAGGSAGNDAGPTGGSAGSSTSAAGAPSDGTTPCVTTADCPATWFCSKNNCGDMAGSCAPRPLICDVNLMPVCGCDHITYWNTCLREDYGVSAEEPGECGASATSCMTNVDCGTPGVSCAHLLPPMVNCSNAGLSGTCWATPNDCATGVDIRHWLPCPAPTPGSPTTCVSTCDAIQSGQTHIQAPRGTQCD